MSAHSNDTYQEITFHHEPAEGTSRIWKTFWLLLGITVVELLLGLAIYGLGLGDFAILLIKGVIVILSLAKAFYIIAIFMHLGDELRNLIMTIAVPCLLFLWFIGAFLWDGNSFKNLRNTFDPYKHEQTTTPVKKDGSHDAHDAGAPAQREGVAH
jgi:cytochrome c oxidase subunit IV